MSSDDKIVPASTPGRLRRRPWRRSLLLLALALLALAISDANYRPTELERAIAPYQYSILDWELEHLLQKWTRAIRRLWPGGDKPTREEELKLVQEFFELGLAQRQLERRLRRAELGGPESAGGGAGRLPEAGPGYIAQAITDNRERRRELLPEVERIVESTLTRILREQDMTTRWLGVFPPVDTVFGSPPSVLALSPRDRIYRQDAFLLQPGLNDAVRTDLETTALNSENLSSVVVNTGGLSVYPSVALDTAGLRYGLEVAAHEWVHHWLFFRPLGRNFQQSPEMLTLNETAATIAGEEMGDLAYAVLTGKAASRPLIRSNPGEFDFTAEMRQTRRRAEEILAQGDIAGAETYMEERRRLFVAQGYNIRKLNQAYFAFHGSYATGPGSISPIGRQVRNLRDASGSLNRFLTTVSQFGSYAEFTAYLEGEAE